MNIRFSSSLSSSNATTTTIVKVLWFLLIESSSLLQPVHSFARRVLSCPVGDGNTLRIYIMHQVTGITTKEEVGTITLYDNIEDEELTVPATGILTDVTPQNLPDCVEPWIEHGRCIFRFPTSFLGIL